MPTRQLWFPAAATRHHVRPGVENPIRNKEHGGWRDRVRLGEESLPVGGRVEGKRRRHEVRNADVRHSDSVDTRVQRVPKACPQVQTRSCLPPHGRHLLRDKVSVVAARQHVMSGRLVVHDLVVNLRGGH
eukprot:scaffold2229_cov262-Pinguiococcus_pyrenoidosus.AAC.6